MSKARYSFIKSVNGIFEFYQDGVFSFRFTRESFRSSFERFAEREDLGSNWIGSMLRLFHQRFPLPSSVSLRTDAERYFVRYGEQAIVDYLRLKGFRVERRFDVGVKDLIKVLEGRGYVVEGLVNDCYYNTEVLK